MISSGQMIGSSILNVARSMLAACIILSYVISGVFHSAHDLDLTYPTGKLAISTSVDGTGDDSSPKADGAKEHCHGCFSIAEPQASAISVAQEIVSAVDWKSSNPFIGVTPETRSPPPKYLA